MDIVSDVCRIIRSFQDIKFATIVVVGSQIVFVIATVYNYLQQTFPFL